MKEQFLKRISSRKFIVLILAVIIFFIKPDTFQGNHLVMVFALYVGGNLATKFMENRSG